MKSQDVRGGTQQSLISVIQQAFPNLTGPYLRKAFKHTFLYVCRCIGANEFRTAMREFEPWRTQEFKVFRLTLTSSFYYYATLRYTGLWFLTNKSATDDELAKHGILQQDAKGLMWLRRNSQTVCDLRKFVSMTYGSVVPRPDEVRWLCGVIVTQLDQSLLSIVRSKLRFLVIFNRLDERDLKADLVARLVQQFMWAFKYRDMSYQRQYALMTAHNAARNMAHYWTTAKRSVATERDATGISSRVLISENEYLVNPTFAVAAPEVLPDVDYDAKRVVVMYGTTDRRRRLLSVLSGVENHSFTLWLRHRKLITENQTNEDACLVLQTDVYLNAAIKWSRVNRKHATRFIKTMRREYEPTRRTHS